MSTHGSLAALRLAALRTVCALTPGLLLSCAGAQELPAAPPSTMAAAAPPVKEELPNLAPVTAPTELFALARFKTPQTAIETVAGWANLPFKLHDVLPAGLRGLEQVVAWDAPVELAAALDPLGEGKVAEPLAVLSIGLTSLDRALEFARAQGQSVRRLRPGVYRIGDADDVSCAAGVALGSVPARLVCGHRGRDVDGLFDYATRGLPNEPLANLDFQLELRLGALKTKYAGELGGARLFAGYLLRTVELDNPRFDRALSDVAYGLVDETLAVVHDLDKVRLEARIDSAQELVNLRLDTKFVGQQSWLVQASAETLPMIAAPPDLFWQLPADATAATFSVGYKPGRLKPLGPTLAVLLDAYLEAEKVPAKLRDRASRAIEAAFDQNTKQVRAQGDLSSLPTDALLAADYRMLGWQIGAVDGDAQHLIALFDGLTQTLASKELARIGEQRLGISPKNWPKFSAHGVTVRGFKAGAKAYRVDVPRALFEAWRGKSPWSDRASAERSQPATKTGVRKPAAVSVPVSFVFAEDGAHTFFGVSPDEKALIVRLESMKDPKTQTLRAREGLSALENTRHTAGGFLTLRSFAGQLAGMGARGEEAVRLLDALPHHGQTPVLVSSDVTAEGPEISASFTVPRALVQDIGALVPALVLPSGG